MNAMITPPLPVPASPPSPYSSPSFKSNVESHTLSVLVDNEPGVLARVVGLFSGRGYNIESLTVAEVAHAEHLSRITIVTKGAPETIDQIQHQLERLVPVHKVTDLTLADKFIEREHSEFRNVFVISLLNLYPIIIIHTGALGFVRRLEHRQDSSPFFCAPYSNKRAR